MKIIAFVTETKPIGQILRPIGALDHAPAIAPARDSPIVCAAIDQLSIGMITELTRQRNMRLIKR